jgi:hypothetical protein
MRRCDLDLIAQIEESIPPHNVAFEWLLKPRSQRLGGLKNIGALMKFKCSSEMHLILAFSWI